MVAAPIADHTRHGRLRRSSSPRPIGQTSSPEPSESLATSPPATATGSARRGRRSKPNASAHSATTMPRFERHHVSCHPHSQFSPWIGEKNRIDVTTVAATNHGRGSVRRSATRSTTQVAARSEEHTSELQSRQYLVCRLLLEKKN